MIFRLLLIYTMILGVQILRSQNLVLNHDFSGFKQCLDRRYNSHVAAPPYTGTYTPANDYVDQFNHWFTPPETGYPQWQDRVQKSYMAHHQNCPNAPINSIVYVPWNPQFCFNLFPTYMPSAVEGNGYAGLVLLDTFELKPFTGYDYIPGCDTNSPVTGFYQRVIIHSNRSFLETKLTQPLQAGEDYTIEFYSVRRAISYYSTGDIEAYISQDTFKYEDYRNKTIIPQAGARDSIYNDRSSYQKWTHIKSSFIALGGEQFLTIGNFNNYSNILTQYPLTFYTPTPNPNPAPWHLRTPADYFFDAVYLYKSSDSVFAVNLPADTTLCFGDSLRLHANHTNTFKIQATKTFTWSTGSTDSSITIGSPGTYWVEVAYNNRWKQYDTIVVDYYPQYQSNLPEDTLICEGSSLNLQVQPMAGVSHQWSNGATGTSTTLSGEGTHWLQSFTPCDTLTDSITVSYFPKETLGLPVDTVLCKGDMVVLQAHEITNAIYNWSNGSNTPEATYDEAGPATLTVYTRCDTLTATTQIEESECEEPEVYIPNSFTPNGDGLNDVFEIVNLPGENSLKVFNRWGEMIFEASPYQNNWDGTTSKGKPATDGIYVFKLRYKWRGQEVVKYNWVNVMRP